MDSGISVVAPEVAPPVLKPTPVQLFALPLFQVRLTLPPSATESRSTNNEAATAVPTITDALAEPLPPPRPKQVTV